MNFTNVSSLTTSDVLFSSSRWDHFRIFRRMMNFTNVSSLPNIRCTFSLHPDEIILEFVSPWWISQCFIIDQHLMYVFSSSRWDHFRISLTMRNFTNVSPLTNISCTFSLHPDEIILQFLLAGWISPMFHHWVTSDVLFSSSRWDHFRIFRRMMNFTNVSSLPNIRCTFSLHPDEIILEFVSPWWISQCFIIDQHLMYVFSSSRWDHFRISLTMRNFTNVSPLTNISCTFSLHPDEIILQFLLAGWISPMFHHWVTSDVLFSSSRWDHFRIFRRMMNFTNVLIIAQHPMYFSYASRWDHFRISLIMINFTDLSSLTNIRCTFRLHQNEIILKLLSLRWISRMFNHWATSDVLFFSAKWDYCRICGSMMSFTNISSFTNTLCTFSLYPEVIILEFVLISSNSPMFHHWRTSDLLFVFIEMRSH